MKPFINRTISLYTIHHDAVLFFLTSFFFFLLSTLLIASISNMILQDPYVLGSVLDTIHFYHMHPQFEGEETDTQTLASLPNATELIHALLGTELRQLGSRVCVFKH